jgi:hypothetical protein
MTGLFRDDECRCDLGSGERPASRDPVALSDQRTRADQSVRAGHFLSFQRRH